MAQFEYKIYEIRFSRHTIQSHQDTMNVYGSQGWELVSTDERYMYFKRKIQ